MDLRRCSGVEKRAEAAVEFGRDVIERLLQTHARQCPVRRSEPRLRLLIRQILEDRGVLRQHFTVVEFKRGDVPFRIDGNEVSAADSSLCLKVDPHRIDWDSRLVCRNVRCECAASVDVIEIHECLPGERVPSPVTGVTQERRTGGAKDSVPWHKFFSRAANPLVAHQRP